MSFSRVSAHKRALRSTPFTSPSAQAGPRLPIHTGSPRSSDVCVRLFWAEPQNNSRAEWAGALRTNAYRPAIRMNALILAAGYATRLYPLTLNKAKPLLEVGGKPMIEWLLDNLASVPALQTVYIVTNAKFASDFQNWANAYQGQHPEMTIKIINKGSKSDDDK